MWQFENGLRSVCESGKFLWAWYAEIPWPIDHPNQHDHYHHSNHHHGCQQHHHYHHKLTLTPPWLDHQHERLPSSLRPAACWKQSQPNKSLPKENHYNHQQNENHHHNHHQDKHLIGGNLFQTLATVLLCPGLWNLHLGLGVWMLECLHILLNTPPGLKLHNLELF